MKISRVLIFYVSKVLGLGPHQMTDLGAQVLFKALGLASHPNFKSLGPQLLGLSPVTESRVSDLEFDLKFQFSVLTQILRFPGLGSHTRTESQVSTKVPGFSFHLTYLSRIYIYIYIYIYIE